MGSSRGPVYQRLGSLTSATTMRTPKIHLAVAMKSPMHANAARIGPPPFSWFAAR